MTTRETVLKHLGGTRFFVMTGASVYAAGEMGVTFQIPRSLTGGEYTHVSFRKRPLDCFDIEKLKIKPGALDPIVIERVCGVFPEMLADAFERFTGLYVKL